MSIDKFNPGHSTNKGYPYHAIMSRELFKNRPVVELVDGKTVMQGKMPDSVLFTEAHANNPVVDFILNRTLDFSKALEIAEDQIMTLLEEKPFMPEQFGFKVVAQNKDIHEPPHKIYLSSFNDKISLYRKPGSPNDPNWNPALWILLKKNEDGTFRDFELHIPCHRIAYALFYGMQIKIEEDKAISDAEVIPEGAETVADVKLPNGFKLFDVIYKGGATIENPDGVMAHITVAAEDKAGATSKGKFIFETEEKFGIKDILFEELTVTEVVETAEVEK